MDDLPHIAARVLEWDGTLAGALPLREAVRALPEARGKPTSEAERAVLLAASAYARGAPPKVERLEANAELARLLGPFLGDPDMGAWPFHDPLRLPERLALRWLPVVGRWATPDPRALEFVRVFLLTRRRRSWVPAAPALADLARRDPTSLALLREWVTASFPHGLPRRTWPQGRLTVPEARAGDNAVHAARHTLVAACAFLARGGVLEGMDAAHLARLPLPSGDMADASAVLLALLALLRGEATRAPVVAAMPARAAEVPVDEQAEEVLRSMAGVLDEVLDGVEGTGAAREAVRARLVRSGWEGAPRSRAVDALWSWLDTARWFQGRGDEEALEAMRDEAGRAWSALDLALDPEEAGDDPVGRLLPLLRLWLDETTWVTTRPAERAPAFAELLLLLARDDLGELPWHRLVERALGQPVPGLQEGPVAEVALADLVRIVAERGLYPAVLLRDARLDSEVVLHLAGSQNEFVARQVAVQVERLLRYTQAGHAQVRLLWQVLQRDPPSRTFRELGTVLRGEDTPLHAVVAAVARLDAIRDDQGLSAADKARSLAGAYVGLADAVEGLLDGAPLVALARDLQGEEADAGSDPWLAALRRMLLGTDEGGLQRWMGWLELDLPDLDSRWRAFEVAIREVREARPAVTERQVRDLEGATADLHGILDHLAWPEALVVGSALRQADRWTEDRREEERRSRRASEHVERLLDRGDDAGVIALVDGVDDHDLDDLPADDLRSLGMFLLYQLRYRRAGLLRRRVRDRVQFPSALAHLTPLIAGVAGGTLLVLDGGTAWTELLLPGRGVQLAASMTMALLLSYGLLAGTLAARTSTRGLRGRAAMLGRVLPTFLGSWALAWCVSMAVLWNLGGTEVRTVGDQPVDLWWQGFQWSTLSLFLGLFLGLVLQGRSVHQDE